MNCNAQVSADHAGALCPILEEHKSRIKAVYFFDFDRKDEKFLRLFNCVKKAGLTSSIQFDRPQTGDVLWKSPAQQLELRVLYPNYAEQVQAGSENSASALIGLFQSDELVITWPGDLTVARIAKKLGTSRSIHLLVGPHHGGPEDRRDEQKEKPISFKPKKRIHIRRNNQSTAPSASGLPEGSCEDRVQGYLLRVDR